MQLRRFDSTKYEVHCMKIGKRYTLHFGDNGSACTHTHTQTHTHTNAVFSVLFQVSAVEGTMLVLHELYC